jgi:hypothetical protein
MLLKKKIGKDSFHVNTYKYGFLICSLILPLPLGTKILTNMILHYVRQFPCKSELSGSMVLERKMFHYFPPYKHM